MIKVIEKTLRPFGVIGLIGFFIGVFIDVMNANENRDLRLFSLLLLWALTLRLLRLKSDITIKVTLGFLGLLFLVFIFAHSIMGMGERIATWIYFMLVIAIVQQFFELRSDQKEAK